MVTTSCRMCGTDEETVSRVGVGVGNRVKWFGMGVAETINPYKS